MGSRSCSSAPNPCKRISVRSSPGGRGGSSTDLSFTTQRCSGGRAASSAVYGRADYRERGLGPVRGGLAVGFASRQLGELGHQRGQLAGLHGLAEVPLVACL